MHLTTLAVHVAAGAVGLVLGPVVLWQERRLTARRTDRPRAAATGYRWAVLVVCASAVVLVAFWRADLWWLAPVAVLSGVLAEVGLRAAAGPMPYRAATLAHGLGGSYIALVTAFVVVALNVDGPVRGTAALLPWLAPTVLGTVLIERWRMRLVHGA